MGWLGNIIDLLKDAVDKILISILAGLTELYEGQLEDVLNTTVNFLTDTPDLLRPGLALSVLMEPMIEIGLMFCVIFFLISISRASLGFISGQRGIRRCIFRFVIAIVLVGNSDQLLMWIINFNDALIIYVKDRISFDIRQLVLLSFNKDNIMKSIGNALNQNLIIFISGFGIYTAGLFLWGLNVFRLIQLMFYMLMSPLVLSCSVIEEVADVVKSFFIRFISVTMKTFFYFITIALYLCAGTLSPIFGFFAQIILSIVLIISLFKLPKEFTEFFDMKGGGASIVHVANTIAHVASMTI